MSSKFKRAFNAEPEYKLEIPKPVLDSLSSELPDGFEYVSEHNGLCRIQPRDSINIDIKHLYLSEYDKKILPADFEVSDIWTYAYNSQKNMEIKPDQNGCFILNGIKISTKDFVKAPFKNIEIGEGEFYLSPPTFPQPFPLVIGSEDCSMLLMIQRIPNDSVSVGKFESVGDNAIKFKYTLDSSNNKLKCTISLVLKNAKSIKEILDAYNIYRAYTLGKGTLAGAKMPSPSAEQNNAVGDAAIEFWEKVLQLEKLFGKSFCPNEKITVEQAGKIERLYHVLVLKKPFKTYQNFEYVTITGSESVEKLRETIGVQVYFEIPKEETFTIFDVELTYVSLMGIFNAKVEAIDTIAGNEDVSYKIVLKTPNDNRMYSSTMYFLDEGSLSAFLDDEDHIKIMEKADEIILPE